MATFNKFNLFVDDLVKKQHNFSSDTFKVMLTNTAPAATNHVTGDITEITAQNGYSAGGAAITVGVSNSSGTETVTGSNTTFTASGGSFGPYRYAVLYNSTASLLVGWWDYGSSISTNSGETFTVQPTGGNLFTLA